MITKEFFGTKPDGVSVDVYTLQNKNGAVVRVLSMGGILQQIKMPDRDGNFADVICGFDTVEGYLTGGGYQGALIGRYGNRIANGRFTLDGVTYQLAQNSNNSIHLHGGNVGFNQKIWDVTPFETADSTGLVLKLTSPDGDENYPGTLHVTVTYTLTDNNELKINYQAVTDKNTIVNMTNHSYFNLGGYDSGDILDHELFVDADSITEVDKIMIPTGNAYPVSGTPFDFRTPEKIGARINDNDQQLVFGGGYDHNYSLNNHGKFAKAVVLFDPKSGRELTVSTDQPGIQIYTANMMNGDVNFKGGIPQKPRHAVCLETQHAPDSPNHPNFPTTELKVGEKYDTTTVFAFSVR